MPGSCSGTWTHGPAKVPQADRQGLSVLQRLREEFLRLVRIGQRQVGPLSISPEDLAKHWHSLAENAHESQGHGSLITKEKQVVALRVSQALQDMDLNYNGRIDIEEWVHYMLLAQSSTPAIRAPQHINAMLKVALRDHPRILHDLQRMFEVADASHTGSLSQDDIADVYGRRLWRLRAADDGTMLSDADLFERDTDALAWELLEAMDVDGDERITYGEFMAYCVGRRKKQVVLHMYDLSSGAASSVSPYLLGERLGGIWHTGIVVFGKEYYFGGEIYYDTPGKTCFGTPIKRIPLGNTLWRQEELHALIVNDLKPIYCREAYDVIFHNCNHFSNRICEWLTGHALPDEVLKQPEKLMQCVFTRAARPLLNRWLIGAEPESHTPWKDGMSGGSTSSGARAEQDAMKPGMVVAIQPADGHGSCVLGAVMSPRHVLEDNSRLDEKGGNEPCSGDANCWVRYFGAPTMSARGCRGAVQTELLPRARLTAVRLSDLALQNAAYQAALRVMMAPTLSDQTLCRASQEQQQPTPRTSAPLGNRKCGTGGASRGLSPASTMVPESMLEGASSPRVSEDSSDEIGYEDQLEGLAAELRVSPEDLKSLVLEDFLPEDWREVNAEGIPVGAVAPFDGEPLLERLPDILQVPSERSAADSHPVLWPPAEWPPVEWLPKGRPLTQQLPAEQPSEQTPREEQPLLVTEPPGPADWLNMEWAEEAKEPARVP